MTAAMVLALAALAAAPVEYPGKVGNGDIVLVVGGETAEAPEAAEFLGQRYPVLRSPGGSSYFLLAVDLDTEPGRYPLKVISQGGVLRVLEMEVQEREYPVEELILPRAMVTPPEEVLDRIAAERKAAAEVYRTSSLSPLWTPPFRRPVEGEPSGNFGRRRVLNGRPRSPHTGEDYSAPRGAEVRSVARGRIRMARDLYYSGKTLLVDHGAGLVSQYFHLDEMLASEGEVVEKGALIGRVGSTGRVTGPHLHFGLRLFGSRVDPSQIWELFPQHLLD